MREDLENKRRLDSNTICTKTVAVFNEIKNTSRLRDQT